MTTFGPTVKMVKKKKPLLNQQKVPLLSVLEDLPTGANAAMEEHKNAAPNCPFILGFDQGIIVRPQNHNKFLCN